MERIFVMKKIRIIAINENRSLDKKLPLCKPFTICTTNGYIVEMEGPFYAIQNDAEINAK